MSTKKLQVIDYTVKQTENADTLDGQHASDFASATDMTTVQSNISDLQSKVGDIAVSAQISNSINALDKADTAKTGQYVSAVSETDGIITVTRSNLPTVDSALSSTSTNAVQNKVVNDAINNQVHDASDITTGTLDSARLPQASVSIYGAVKVANNFNNTSSNSDSDVVTLGFYKDAVSKMNIVMGTKADVSDLTSHTGNTTVHITSGERTKWNTAATTASNVSTLVGDTAISTQITTAINAIDYPVDSVNGKTGAVTLTAADVGALPSNTNIPSISGLATETYVDNKVAGIVDTAPEALDTLNELAAALGDDPNFATTVATQIGTKVDKVDGKGLSTNDYTTTEKTKLAGIETGATKTTIDSALSATSTNPVQNKIVTAQINNLNTLVGDTAVATQITNAIANKVDKVSGKGLSTNDYTTDEKTKLSGIASGAEVNQNAFSNVTVGSTTIAADSKTDTLTLVAGDNVTLTPDATNDKVTIASKDTVYTHPTYTSKSSGLYKIAVDGTGHVSSATAVAKSDITALGIPAQDTTYSTATQSANGLMSSSDKTKLDGVESGANKTVVDSALSSTSTNPVQNKVVNSAIANLNTLVGDTAVSTQITNAIADKSDVGHTHDDRYYTESEIDTKLSGKSDASHTHSAYVNQNAFSNVAVGSTTVAADSTTDTLTLVAGNNVTITPDATNDKITIAATDTVYTHPSYTARTGVPTANATPAFGGTFSVSQPVSDATGHITAINSRTVTIPSTAATTSAAGLMSADDKTKLDGIATGATKVTVDSALSSTSTNPVQNKAVNTAITDLNTLVGDTAVSTQITNATNNFIKGLSVSGQTVTYTKGDGSTGTITTQDTNTTYSNATTSAAGLMSASDKSKLDGITSSADSVSFSASATSGNKVGTITINGTDTDMYSPTQTTVSGNAGTATKLATARTIQTDLASASAASFDGSADVAPGVTGVLSIENGGTGASDLETVRSNLGVASSGHTHSGTNISPISIELRPSETATHGGYIDFHYAGSEEDYTSRIIESESGRISISGGLTLGAPLAVEYGGTGVTTNEDIAANVFGRNYESWQNVTSYPTKPGIYRATGTNIFSNMTAKSNYGILVIFQAVYAIHIYLDAYNNVFIGRSGDTFGEPTVWQYFPGIVEDGTSGIWTYRKYANGIAECWGRQSYSGTTSTTWGSLYALVCDAPNYPFTFTALPTVERSVSQSSGNSCWISGWSAESSTNSGRFALIRPTSADLSAVVNFRAVGKWK